MEVIKKEVLKSLPSSPGVYLLKDKKGRLLYIGKAKNLRIRLRSYLTQNVVKDQRPQIPYLMQEICDLDYFVTQNERDALLLENSLIKQKKPKYNIRLKDDKNYASLRLDPREKFPKLTYTRRVLRDGAMYYGPFASGQALRQTKRLIHKIFPLRDCTDEKFKRHSTRPCLNYYMKLCLGPCAGKVDKGRYGEVVEQTKVFLKGERKEIIRLLCTNMNKASEELRYEDAAHYRDQIELLKRHLGVDLHISSSLMDKDIVGFYRDAQFVEFVVLFSRGGAIIDMVEYPFNNATWEDEEIVREFIGQLYGGERFIPQEIIIPLRFEGVEALREWLSEKRGKKIRITVPKRGANLKLLEIACRNAEESFRRRSTEKQKELSLLQRVKDSLSLSKIPFSIECFDISNIQGNIAVASMVRFEDGKPAKSRYRRYRIKTVFGANDYAMIYEVLQRRLKRAEEEDWELPELILIDGGKGQLNIVHQVLSELGFLDKVKLASIAKGREEGEIDKIYIPGRKDPVPLTKNSQELLFLMRIRDEAHRFAITYHKKLRAKKAFESQLDLIKGIGKRRREILLRHFGSISGIRGASIEEISSIPGMNRRIAQEIKRYLAQWAPSNIS
ncbi:MAG: excinuclease ABC subunit C, excinuclease ABC subunit C [Candidatus Dadabacteria bacterium CSP1-2]|nr:MAG: excinuclease ABC subunit C, excinuclease ABC subunit C [Candidatus Dadabacteria bacterium CSP1-2]